MTYEQYWDDDVFLVRSYRKAYELKKERINNILWLQGLYVYQTLIKVSPAFRPMNKSGPEDYMSEPLPITDEDLKQRKKEKAKKQQELLRDKMEAFASTYNKEKKKDGDEDVRSDSKHFEN